VLKLENLLSEALQAEDGGMCNHQCEEASKWKYVHGTENGARGY